MPTKTVSAPVAALISEYKETLIPFKPRAYWLTNLEILAAKLSAVSTRQLATEYEYYNYLILNPLKPGKFKYTLPSGKIIKLDHEPFYGGKGNGRRLTSHLREANNPKNKGHKVNTIRKIWKTGKEPIIIQITKLIPEALAFAYEIDLIAGIGRYGLRTGPLNNGTEGGEGGSGHILSRRTRSKISATTKGRPPSARQLASLAARTEEAKTATREGKQATWAAKSEREKKVIARKKRISMEAKSEKELRAMRDKQIAAIQTRPKEQTLAKIEKQRAAITLTLAKTPKSEMDRRVAKNVAARAAKTDAEKAAIWAKHWATRRANKERHC